MKAFSQFGIRSESQRFVGDKIKIVRILNRKITVIDYRIEESKFQQGGGDKCLHMQIELDGTKHVVFTGSRNLAEVIQKIPKADFPFTTTIVKDNDMYEFT